MKRYSLLGLLWVSWKFLEFVMYDFETFSLLLALFELPLMIWWFVECVKHLQSKNKLKTSAWFQASVSALFILLWVIFFAIGVLMEAELL